MTRLANEKTVAFVGPKHVGKSSVAACFASLIGRTFIDLDDLISEISGQTAADLYEAGLDCFRRTELEAVRSLAGLTAPLVLAAGGGLVDNSPALALLKDLAVLVYLRVDVNTVWRRVLASAEKRGSLPVFLRGTDPETRHRQLFERRSSDYEDLADFCLDAQTASPQELAERAVEVLGF